MATDVKFIDSLRVPLTIAGGVLVILALILCVTALLVSDNPLYFVFGVIVVSLLGIMVSMLHSGRVE